MKPLALKWAFSDYLPKLAVSWSAFVVLAAAGAASTGMDAVCLLNLIPWFLVDTALWAVPVSAALWAGTKSMELDAWDTIGVRSRSLFIVMSAVVFVFSITTVAPLAFNYAPAAAALNGGKTKTKIGAYTEEGSLWLAEKQENRWQIIAGVAGQGNELKAYLPGKSLPARPIESPPPDDSVFDALAMGARSQGLAMLFRPFDRERKVEGFLRIEGVLSLPVLFLIGSIIGQAARYGGRAALYGVLLGVAHSLAREIARAPY
jgi:hypothetical protein